METSCPKQVHLLIQKRDTQGAPSSGQGVPSFGGLVPGPVGLGIGTQDAGRTLFSHWC